MAAGRDPDAVEAFREAISLAARAGEGPEARARLYRRVGQAEEKAGHPDRAYDAYRMALRLDPDEPLAKKRIAEMEKAAGI